MKKFFKSLLAVAVAGAVSVQGFAAEKNIVETAVEAGKFKTLAAALGAADLVEALQGEGPFTVFAPSDEAFEKLPEGTVATLLKPENKAKLAGILTYHVVSGKVMAEQVVGLTGATTLNGQRVDIKVDGGNVMVDGAKVTSTDVVCSNGVIHIIDSVILPADKNLADTAIAAGSFKTLVAAAQAAGLVEALTGDAALTVFAPTDEAFAKLPKGTVEMLLKPENKGKLADILKYHVVAGRVYSEAAVKAKSASTLQGSPVSIAITDKGAMVNNAKLVATDIDASNGVIHVIDTVMMPPAKGANVRHSLENAIVQGSQLFNAGHHEACANLYHNTLNGLMTADVNSSLKTHMKSVLTSASHQSCSTERAWTLRRGIDQMYIQLTSTH
jgi:transforming growth factor-beta-induced protein